MMVIKEKELSKGEEVRAGMQVQGIEQKGVRVYVVGVRLQELRGLYWLEIVLLRNTLKGSWQNFLSKELFQRLIIVMRKNQREEERS